jgi:predicted negative regulator of RcsB-dependent stress response
MAQRVARKEIRRPDPFVLFTGRVLQAVRQRPAAFAAIAAAIALLILAWWGFDLYRARQHRLAGLAYTQGLALYHNSKYAAAIESFLEAKHYAFTPYAKLGLLHAAHSYQAAGEPKKAEESLRELLAAGVGDPVLHQLALLSLGEAHRAQGQTEEALQAFGLAHDIAGPFKEEALLARAEANERAGKTKEAAEFYKQYLSTYQFSPRMTEIALRLQEVEAALAKK